jgi:hypothetical protein
MTLPCLATLLHLLRDYTSALPAGWWPVVLLLPQW